MDAGVARAASLDDLRHSWALAALCSGVLMNSVSATIVNLALASIGDDLGLSDAALVWVINAYLSAYGGCLLLGSRLGELFGDRRVLLSAVALFTCASLACALAPSAAILIAARALQGVGGAVVSAGGLALIVKLFSKTNDRARALGMYALVSASAASASMLLGGVITSALSWRWVFLINVPVGVCVWLSCLTLLPRDRAPAAPERLDVGGAATITAASMLGVYTLLDSSRPDSSGMRTLCAAACTLALLCMFIRIEARQSRPLLPLALFRARRLLALICSAALLSAVALAWSVLGALYLQRILLWSPLQTGLIFLPANLATALTSFAVTPALVVRYGFRAPMTFGFLCAAAGLTLLAALLTGDHAVVAAIAGMVLVGVGVGLSYSPVVLAAVSAARPKRAAIVSGVVNTSFAVGGAVGLAALATLGVAKSHDAVESGAALTGALQDGYRLALAGAAALALTGCLISVLLPHQSHAPRSA